MKIFLIAKRNIFFNFDSPFYGKNYSIKSWGIIECENLEITALFGI